MAIDVHCHLQDFDESYIKSLLKQKSVYPIISGYSESSNKRAYELHKKYSIPFYVGIAPQVVINEQFSFSSIKKFLDDAVAIGEVGLDYKWAKTDEERKKQKDAFIKFLDLAHTFKLPLVIHCRNAYTELIELLKEYGNKQPILMHSFFGTTLHATLLSSNWKVLFSINTVKTKDKKAVIRRFGINFFVTETDCPYIDKNPEMVYKSISMISEEKNMDERKVEELTMKNAIEFFKLEKEKIKDYCINNASS